MLEGLVARVLNSLLGKYVQEFDAEGLNVGIFSGDACLHDLKLKPSCLYELELPVEVVSGVIGELKMTIPWNYLSAKAIEVTIQDLFIVALPLGVLPYDGERDKQLTRALKRRIVDRVEALSNTSLQTLLQHVVPMLGHTVQLHVRNVHIRYEDPRAGAAAGIFIQEFSVETTNSKWKPVNQQSGSSTYQLVRVDALSIYLNAGLDRSQFIVQDGGWVQHMRTALLQFQVKGSPLDFVVKPLNSKLKVIVGRGESLDAAPLLVDVVVQDAVVVLSHRQLAAARSIMELFSRIPLHREYLAVRPCEPVKGHSGAWWRYAYAASVQQRVLPYTWARLFSLRRCYRQYRELYKQTVQRPGDMELRLDLQRAEDNLPLSCIIIAREHAKLEIRGESIDMVDVVEVTGTGQYQLSIRRTKSIEEQKAARAFIEHKLNVTVDNLSLSWVRDGREVLAVGLAQCLSSFETRMSGGWKVSARAGNVLVEGTSPDFELVPLLSSPATHTGNTPFTCFSLDIEEKPQSEFETVNHAISLTIMPMELIYQEHAFSELLSWTPSMDWGSFFSSWWKKIAEQFTNQASRVPSLDLHASVHLPRIILPESGSLQKGGLVLVVDPGKWEVETELQPLLTMEEVGEMTQMELEERLYHRLLVQCSGAQILFTDSGEEWRDLARRDESDAHLVSRLRGSLALSLSIKPEYRLLPRLKLNIGVPALHVNVSERRAQQLLDVLETVPRPAPRFIMFQPAQPLWPQDRIMPELNVVQLCSLARKMVALELSRQRTPDSLASPMPPEGLADLPDLGFCARSVVSDASDEELELWARTVDLPGFEDNVSPHNTISALLRVTIGELALHLPRNVGFQDKPYLMLRLARISLDVALMQYGPAVQAALGGFQLIDKLHIGPSGEYLEIVSTQSDQDFFSLLYRKVRADCPDFKSHFHGVEQSVVVDVGYLALVLQRDAYQNIHKFIHDFTQRIVERPIWDQLPACKWWKQSCDAADATAQPVWNIWSWWGQSKDDPPVPPGGTKYSYSIHLAELRLRLREAEVDMLEILAGGLEGDWALRANERLVLRVYLQRLSVEDLGEATLYSRILAQDEDHVLEMRLVRLSPGARLGVSHGTLKISLARLHVLLAVHVMHTLQRFLELLNGTLPVVARRAASSWLESFPRWEGALQLSLILHLPTVLWPPGPTVPALLILNMGDLTVENFLKDNGTGGLVDNILVRIENAFVTRGLITLAGSLESREEVVAPLKLTLDIKRILAGIPVLDIVGSVDAVRVAIGQRDLALLIDVYAANRSISTLLDVTELWGKGEESVELRTLQAFLHDGDVRRRDSSFRFSMDSFTLTFYTDIDEQLSSPVRDNTHALCKLQLQDVMVSVETRASGVCELRLSVHNCLLEDVRPDSGVVTRVLGARPGGDSRLDSAISVSSPPLVDVVGKQSERGDRCVDILVEKTRLSLSASFLAALARFISDAAPDKRDGGCDNLGYVGDPIPKCKDTSSCSDHVHDAPAQRQRGLSLSLQLRRPEIALLAEGGVGLVARCELLLDCSRCPGRDELVLRLAGLRVVSIQPAPVVMRPCDVEVVRNVNNAGVQVTVAAGPVEFTLCSAAFTACTSILEELQTVLRDRREVPQLPLAYLVQVDDLWSPKKIAACCEATLCGPLIEPPHSEPHSFPAGSPLESMSVSVAKITAVFGLQTDLTCRPIFIAKAGFTLQAHDWSSAPSLNGKFQIEAACWNDNLELWETIVEPWSASLELYQGKALPISPCAGRQPRSRRSQDPPPPPPASDSSGDESEPGMTFLRPHHFHLQDVHRSNEVLSDNSDSELNDGALERMRGAVAHLFVDEEVSSGGEASSDEVETESASSETCRSPATERAVFLNKHADSVDSGLETEAVDRLATYLLINSSHRLEISVTPYTLAAVDLLRSPQMCNSPKPLANHLGPGAVVTLLEQGNIVASCNFDEDSPPSTPGSASPCPSPSRESSTSGDTGRVSPDLSYPRENLAELQQRICGSQLLLQIPGFESQTVNVGRVVGDRQHPLSPLRHGVQYNITVSTSRTNGMTHYVVTGPLQIKNETSYAIGVYYKNSALLALGESALGESSNPFDDMLRLAVVAPDDLFHVPLAICYHCKLHFLPAHLTNHTVSAEGILWQDMRTMPDTIRDILCPGSDGEVFSLRVCWTTASDQQRVLRVCPPWLLKNLLPCACEINLPSGQRVRLEAGEEINAYSINPRETCSIALEVPEYMGLCWSGTLMLVPDCKEKIVVMETEQDTDGGNKQLTVNVLVTRAATATILFYAPYWLLNKTGLPLQIRGSGSDMVQEWAGQGPLFFSYRKQRSRTVRLRVLTSSWSSAFSLDPVGCAGLVVCRDRERSRRYRVLVQCQPSQVQPALCRILTFLPHVLVENACKKHLRFMEDNEKADLWHDINPGQCMPFWPDTDSLRMVVRLRDSKHVSPAFPVATPHVTALRMDKGCTLTVEVTGGEGNPLRVLLRPYKPGDAPVRVDNHCADVFLKLRQKGCPQVALLSPYHSLLYTWDDACKDRELLWSVYNNAGRELRAQLTRDACGEERVSFRSVRNHPGKPLTRDSSASSDSDPDPSKPDNAATVMKETRKDTVVVYWTSFLQSQQRVLLLTQDERLARKARRAVEAERSSLELCLALSGGGISLSNHSEDGKLRELAYLSVHSAPARWELSVAQRWKAAPADLASWLENNYKHGVTQAKIKDYINVDLGTMQMSRPLFGTLRRRQRPALWVQYRAARHLSVLQAHLHRVQVDDQRLAAVMPCMFRASPSAGTKPAIEVAVLWRHGVNGEDAVKFVSLTAQEHSVHVDSDWLSEVCALAERIWRREDAQTAMRRDIARLHTQLKTAVEEGGEVVVEQLHCMDLLLDLTLVPSSAPTTTMPSALKPLGPVPDVLAALLCAVAAAPAPISNIPIKLCGLESVGGLWSVAQLQEHVASHYVIQLLQQLHVLVLGLHVLATPTARLATRVPSVQEGVVLPEEFSDTVSSDLETRLAVRNGTNVAEDGFPSGLWTASRAFPLACALGLSGLAVTLPRGPPCLGLDAFCRGPGRAVGALLAAFQIEPSICLPDALHLLLDAVARCAAMGDSVICRARPPRSINPILGMRPFSMVEAQGVALLESVCRGRYSKDDYWSHAPLTLSHSSLFLITLQRVLLVEQVGASTLQDVTWTSTWDTVESATLRDLSMVLTIRQGVEVSERQISCWNPEVLHWLHARMQEAIVITKN